MSILDLDSIVSLHCSNAIWVLLYKVCFIRGQNTGRGGVILTPNELVLTFGGSYVCASFGENRSRNATVRVLTDRHTH